MSNVSPILVICLDQEEAGFMAELVRSLGYPDVHVIPGGFAEAKDALALRPMPPDYIIIDIGTRGSEMLPELDDFAEHCEPSARVVVVGAVNDILFYRELKNRGVLEYFPRPLEPADIRAVLLTAQPRRVAAVEPGLPQGKVIAVMSAASGDGSSTLAQNLAYCLARDHKRQTVLVDMDYQFGLIANSLDLAAPFGIRELFDHPDRGLDELLISKMLVPYKDNLSIISAPSELRLLPVIRPEVIRELVALLRSRFAFIVIDLPHVWTDWTAAGLSYSDHAIMVAQLWLRSLIHASRLLTAWNTIGVTRDSLSLVINRSGAKFKEAVSIQDFERICRHRIDAHVDNDIKAISEAEKAGGTLLESEYGAVVQQQIKDLAAAMLARYAGPGAAIGGNAAPVSSGGLRALLAKVKK